MTIRKLPLFEIVTAPSRQFKGILNCLKNIYIYKGMRRIFPRFPQEADNNLLATVLPQIGYVLNFHPSEPTALHRIQSFQTL